MSRFTEILTVSPLPNGKSWVLRKPFGYDVGHEDSGETIEIYNRFYQHPEVLMGHTSLLGQIRQCGGNSRLLLLGAEVPAQARRRDIQGSHGRTPRQPDTDHDFVLDGATLRLDPLA